MDDDQSYELNSERRTTLRGLGRREIEMPSNYPLRKTVSRFAKQSELTKLISLL